MRRAACSTACCCGRPARARWHSTTRSIRCRSPNTCRTGNSGTRFAPSLFDLVPRDYAIGTRPNVFDINGVLAGVAICFDIVDDGLIHQMIDGGAQVILAPTNNADFGHTDESVQQLAIARLRAMETSRAVVNISTVGTSAIIAPDGSTIASLPTWTPGSMVEEVPLSDATTPAMMFGRELEWVLTGLSFAALVVAVIVGRRRRTGGTRG